MTPAIDFKGLYEDAPCGLITFKPDGTITHANQTLLSWLGVDQAALRDLKFTDILYKGKLYYNLFVQPLLLLHAEVNEINFEINTPGGTLPVLFSALMPAADLAENTLINGVIFKIADRQKYEKELLRKKKLIEGESLQKDEALSTIAFNQSHLVRAPLANILALVDLLETTDVDEETNSILEMLKISARNLDQVVNEIVVLSNS